VTARPRPRHRLWSPPAEKKSRDVARRQMGGATGMHSSAGRQRSSLGRVPIQSLPIPPRRSASRQRVSKHGETSFDLTCATVTKTHPLLRTPFHREPLWNDAHGRAEPQVHMRAAAGSFPLLQCRPAVARSATINSPWAPPRRALSCARSEPPRRLRGPVITRFAGAHSLGRPTRSGGSVVGSFSFR
jgi:hypothetical protein